MPGYASQAETAVGNAGPRVAAIGGPGDDSLMLFDPISDGLVRSTRRHGGHFPSVDEGYPDPETGIESGRPIRWRSQAHEPHRGSNGAPMWSSWRPPARVPTTPAMRAWHCAHRSGGSWDGSTTPISRSSMAWAADQSPMSRVVREQPGRSPTCIPRVDSTQRPDRAGRSCTARRVGHVSSGFASDLLRRPVAGASQPRSGGIRAGPTLVVVVSVGLGAYGGSRRGRVLDGADRPSRAPRRRARARV